jgi:hypothetical protein
VNRLGSQAVKSQCLAIYSEADGRALYSLADGFMRNVSNYILLANFLSVLSDLKFLQESWTRHVWP